MARRDSRDLHYEHQADRKIGMISYCIMFVGFIFVVLLFTPSFILSATYRAGYPVSSHYINKLTLEPPQTPSRWVYTTKEDDILPNGDPKIASSSRIPFDRKPAIAYFAVVAPLALVILFVLVAHVIPRAASTRGAPKVAYMENLDDDTHAGIVRCFAPIISAFLIAGFAVSILIASFGRVPDNLQRVWKADLCAKEKPVVGGSEHKAVVTWEIGVKIPDAQEMDGTTKGGKMWITRPMAGSGTRHFTQDLEFVGRLEKDGAYVLEYHKGVPDISGGIGRMGGDEKEKRAVQKEWENDDDAMKYGKTTGPFPKNRHGMRISKGMEEYYNTNPEYCYSDECFFSVQLRLPPLNIHQLLVSPDRNVGNITYTTIQRSNIGVKNKAVSDFVVDGKMPEFGMSYENRCIPWSPFSLLSAVEPMNRPVLFKILLVTAMEMAHETLKQRAGR